MHLLITDSGVGGVSVVAYAERFVRTHGWPEPVRLTFANAAPANDYGYNSMPSHAVRIETFDRFLRRVTERYHPDLVYVACNTLSVLLPETAYAGESPGTGSPVRGIVETGVEVLLRALGSDPRSTAVIFATQTTVDAGTYPRVLAERGIEPSRIVTQACPGLADTISEDREGARSAAEIRRWVGAAVEKLPTRTVPIVASLNCTHYGYRKELFAEALAAAGVAAAVVNPNERAADDLFDARGGAVHDVDVHFVTRYPLPDATVESLTFFLGGIGPKTVESMRNFECDPDLF